MSTERNAVREKFSQCIRVVTALPDPRKKLRSNKRDVSRVESRLHEPAGEDGPRRVEYFRRRLDSEHRPVVCCRCDDFAPQRRHFPAQRSPRIFLCPAIGNLEKQRLDPRIRGRYLTRAAEQVEVGGNDVVGVALSENDLNSRHFEAVGGCRERESDGEQHQLCPPRASSSAVRFSAARSLGEMSTPVM